MFIFKKEWFSFDLNSTIKQDLQSNTNKESSSLQTEHFMCIDITGLMYSFSIENGAIKDSGKFLPGNSIYASKQRSKTVSFTFKVKLTVTHSTLLL